MYLRLRNESWRVLFAMLVLLVMSATDYAAVADPISGRDTLKFSQQPMLDTQLVDDAGFKRGFHGHDELSTAWSVYEGGRNNPFAVTGYRGTLMADDFADRLSSAVVHVKWWGSYLNGPLQGVDKFLISFSADIPAVPGAGGFSRPGAVLHSQLVSRGPLSPGSGTFTEQQVYPLSVDGPIYEYNAELHFGKEFRQQPDTVYWLTIAALVDVLPRTDPLTDPNVIRWGWHNRDYTIQDALASVPPAVAPGEHIAGVLPGNGPVWHFQDDAVSGDLMVQPGRQGAGLLMPFVQQRNFQPTQYQPIADGPLAIGRFSKDLAFELYSVPEPAAALLLSLGALLIGCEPRRERHRRATHFYAAS